MPGVEAQVGIRMKDFGEWKPLLNKTSHVRPRHPALLTATLEVGNDRVVGNTTSEELAQLIARAHSGGAVSA
jgi:hypothetical protein